MEMLDIVDHDDNVVGAMSRDEIHRQQLIHRSCHMLLFNSKNQLFVQKRSMSKDEGAGMWDSSAAGHVDSGENYLQCAIRELDEELGLKVSAADLTEEFKLPPIPDTGMEFSVIYTVRSDLPLTLDSLTLDYEEIETGDWFSIKKLDLWMSRTPNEFGYGFQLIWSRLRPGLTV